MYQKYSSAQYLQKFSMVYLSWKRDILVNLLTLILIFALIAYLNFISVHFINLTLKKLLWKSNFYIFCSVWFELNPKLASMVPR